ncbi:unnamed protein product [Blepharisma stoltei]|uniref:Uncharacterized protein n=1 Tax=Blepharisma stoltei TaxID=1481888 RepID=A0AAU9KBD8_9CILI|nr:unnamed protein product [Blepharisma stoltei]
MPAGRFIWRTPPISLVLTLKVNVSLILVSVLHWEAWIGLLTQMPDGHKILPGVRLWNALPIEIPAADIHKAIKPIKISIL